MKPQTLFVCVFMFSMVPASDESVRERIARMGTGALSYDQLAWTRHQPTRRAGGDRIAGPKGWNVDHSHGCLGSGEDCWERAVAKFRLWAMFDLGWVEVLDPGLPLEEACVAAVRIRSLGVHIVALARIVYTIDEPDRFGFAYGTLSSHPERGEERFLLERDGSGKVWYDLLAMSRPGHPLTWFGYPWVRAQQARFARDSILAMQRACGAVE